MPSPHLSPYHPYSSPHHPSSPRSPHFHHPLSPIFHTKGINGPTLNRPQKRQHTRLPPSPVNDDPTSSPCQRPIKRVRFNSITPSTLRTTSTVAADLDLGVSEGRGIPLHATNTHTAPPHRNTMDVQTSSNIGDTFSTSPNIISSSPPDFSAVTLNDPSSSSSSTMPPVQVPRRTASPPSLPPLRCMKRSNPKCLSLSLTMPTSSSSSSLATPSTLVTPTYNYQTPDSSHESTPYTPGPPQTPALAMSASVGRATTKGFRRPSLLSLITQPSSNNDDIPPTPNGARPYSVIRPPRIRARSSTASEAIPHLAYEKDYKSAHPSYRSFPPIEEYRTPQPDFGYHHQTSPSSSSQTSPQTSASASTSSTPSSSPPLPTSSTFATTTLLYSGRNAEPYQDGPIEIIPNVYLGAENSASDLTWARGRSVVRILNVAQEIDDPFEGKIDIKGKGKEKIKLADYPSTDEDGSPRVEYCHLKWSHGEGGLAELPEGANLAEVITAPRADIDADSWGFWNAIRWMEEARRQDTPVLIHCQCGISRSATMIIAYLMCLAVSGLAPEYLGHLKGMQDTYDFVKAKSSCVGPNVSLVFQLVEFQRTLTSLLSDHLANPALPPIKTSFPTLAEVNISEAEWARKRREFEIDEEASAGDLLASPLSPEEAGDEARRLDEAMVLRRLGRE